MKILITNYSFNASARTITFPDYVSGGVALSSVLLIVDTTINKILYNFADPSVSAMVSVNVLTLASMPGAAANGDALLIYYDDPNALEPISLGSGIRQDLDSITVFPAGTTYKGPLTASGVILAQPGRLVGAMVNSTTSGIIRIWDNPTTNSGNKILDSIQLPVGPSSLFNMQAIAGAYMEVVSGSINITFATI